MSNIKRKAQIKTDKLVPKIVTIKGYRFKMVRKMVVRQGEVH